ncbi:MAG: HAD family phosphatase [Dethiobacter sp.]|jgi:Cof subfamily protein (haloacid dehalogenase superfamily)|nr:HAD family phosphatase [Dethiobacter sp.]
MSFKLLALDLDDTLLNEEFKISEQNRAAIRRAAGHGALITLATGRMFRSALPFARELEIDLPLITYHGALIKTAGEEETLFHKPVPLPLALEVAAYCKKRGFHVNAYIDDELLVEEENEFSRFYQSIANIKLTVVGDLISYMSVSPTKLTIINREGKLPSLQEELISRFGSDLAIVLSRPHFLEVTDRLATKGQALKYLADLHGIAREDVAAIGDSYNDIDMLIYAGTGVAVANAPQDVKSFADVVTASNLEHGVAVFINRFMFDEEGR